MSSFDDHTELWLADIYAETERGYQAYKRMGDPNAMRWAISFAMRRFAGEPVKGRFDEEVALAEAERHAETIGR